MTCTAWHAGAGCVSPMPIPLCLPLFCEPCFQPQLTPPPQHMPLYCSICGKRKLVFIEPAWQTGLCVPPGSFPLYSLTVLWCVEVREQRLTCLKSPNRMWQSQESYPLLSGSKSSARSPRPQNLLWFRSPIPDPEHWKKGCSYSPLCHLYWLVHNFPKTRLKILSQLNVLEWGWMK